MKKKPAQIRLTPDNDPLCIERNGVCGAVRPVAVSVFGTIHAKLCLGIGIFLMILVAFQANTADGRTPTSSMSITFESTLEDGTQVEFTVNKTGSDKGTIREKRWRKGHDPTKDAPDFEETIKIYQIRVSSDGTELVGKADVRLKDPIVIFTLNRPEDQDPKQKIERPAITLIVKGTSFGLKDRTTIYIITQKEREDLRIFLKNANFPKLANAH